MNTPDLEIPVRVNRTCRVPAGLRLSRFRKAPEYGPRILFFSGGTALNALSRYLVDYTYNSVHLTTPFDSGGSSGKLRGPFRAPAVGDMRSRIMALANRTVTGQAEVVRLFSHRFPVEGSAAALRRELGEMIDGSHPLVAAVMEPMRDIIRHHLEYFADEMPPELDLRGASIGNLVLVGGYVNHQRQIEPVVFLFSKLVEARGTVLPILAADLHLAARLADGHVVHGQHRLTGKEEPAIASPVSELFLSRDLEGTPAGRPQISPKVRRLIERADLICFPVGSFYSSVVANLLPGGVGSAVAANHVPKVYVLNTGRDPEQLGLSPLNCVQTLIRYLGAELESPAVDRLLTHVMVDSDGGDYGQALDLQDIRDLGVEVIDAPLVTGESAPFLDERRIAEVLLSIC